MYQVSRAIYRELAPDVVGGRDAHERVLRACEATIERMVGDRHYFARPARTLFHDVRPHIALGAQGRAWRVVQAYVRFAEQLVERMPVNGVDAHGNPLQCRATTRRGTPCQRVPLHDNGYCPSHQHLAETEQVEASQPLAA
ncbi:MAG TPA: DUF5763 domain-containing protein [Solirubrobacteraceae bacterium]|nr:DUF5763 domain-containing protein [Solirubrobacteraceae bacterium]HSD81516.1 DUF5763 domain-containing protein [Solirubrobacteraceae bacterium]